MTKVTLAPCFNASQYCQRLLVGSGTGTSPSPSQVCTVELVSEVPQNGYSSRYKCISENLFFFVCVCVTVCVYMCVCGRCWGQLFPLAGVCFVSSHGG